MPVGATEALKAAGGYPLAGSRPPDEAILRPVRVLLTNDDGVESPGLAALAAALAAVADVVVAAPAENQSGVARAITLHGPIAVDATTVAGASAAVRVHGTPVDCVRLAHLGLLGDPPDVVVSGANLGLNLGDDVTYSGTVAAAFEGMLLGLPAIAVSQQSTAGDTGYAVTGGFDFAVAARFTAALVARLAHHHLAVGTILNVNVPGLLPRGVAVTRLGKRIYNDRLELVGEDATRRIYRVYGGEPDRGGEKGTDIVAIDEGLVSITALHLDLSLRESREALAPFDLEAALHGSA